eukprot:tig00000254_g22474.t1
MSGRGAAGARDRLDSLVKALARPAAFPETAAELLATAFGATLVELYSVERGRLRGLLAAHGTCTRLAAAAARNSAAELAPWLPAVLASREPVSIGAAGEAPRYAVHVRTTDEEAAASAAGASAVVSVAFESGEGGLPAEERALLVRAAALVALGLEAHCSCPVEAIARAVRRSADPAALGVAAEAARAALHADWCWILEAPSGSAAPERRGAAPADTPGAPPLPEGVRPRGPWASRGRADAEAGVGELAAGRAVLRAGGTPEAPLLAQPIAVGGRLVGALVAARDGGSAGSGGADWSAEEAEAAACCAWTLGPALVQRGRRVRPGRASCFAVTRVQASEAAACARLAAAKAEIEAQNRALQRQLRENGLIRRLANEINACSGVQAAFDGCAELLCQLFDATRAYLFDLSSEARGIPRAKYAVPGSPYGDSDVTMSDDLIEGVIGLCNSSRDGVFVRNGVEQLPPDFQKFATTLSCVCALSGKDSSSSSSAVLVIEKADEIANWGPDDSRFLRLVADQIGIALAQSALREQVAVQNRDLQREVRNSALLAGIVREISQEVDESIEHIFHRSAELVGKAFNVDRCSLWQYFDNTYQEPITDPHVVWVAHDGIPKDVHGYDAATSSAWWDLLHGSPDGVLHLPDVRGTDERPARPNEDAELLKAASSFASRSSMSTKVVFRGQIQGIIGVVMCRERCVWSPEDRLLLRQVAEHIGVAIAHGRLLEQQRTHAAQLEQQLIHSGLLETMTREIHQVLGVREVYQLSARLLREAFGASRVRVWSLDGTDLSRSAVDAAPGLPDTAYMDGREIALAAEARIGFNPGEIFKPIFEGLAAGGRRLIAISDCSSEEELARNGFEEAHLRAAKLFFEMQSVKSVLFVSTIFRGVPNSLVSVAQLDRVREWKPEDIRLLDTVSEQIGAAISQSLLLRNETEQRELLARQNVALEEARREADAASAAKSQFLAMVSHEIRTPMNALCNMSEFLLDTELSPQQREFCTVIQTSSLALLNILNDILDTSRLEFNKVEIRRAPVVLRELFQQAAELMFPSAAQKGIDLAWHVARECPAVLHTDGARLNQILVNTLGNGIKFTSRGEVSLTARMMEGEQLCITVRDTGIGISAEDQEKLFSWFYQVDSSHSREYGGTGLGLFISRKLAVLLGGDLRVESELGQGSAFNVIFPVRALAEEGASLVPSPPPLPSDGTGGTLSGRRVAVWSPSPVTRALVRDALEDAGAAVEDLQLPPPAADDAEAPGLEAGAGGGGSGPLDCCVLDTAQPASGSGVGFALPDEGASPSSSPAWRRLAGVPRVALVARGSAGLGTTVQACAQAVPKPVKPRAVVEAVNAAIGARDGRCGSPDGPQRPQPAPRPRARPRPVSLESVDTPPPSFSGSPAATGATPPAAASELRILVAEDVEVNTKILLLLLKKGGYTRVQAVSNGAEALAAVHAAAANGRQFHCLLLDVMMPVMDGLTAARRIRAELPAERRPYIIVLTANAMAGDREQCLECGMSDYLSKPVRMDALVAALKRCEMHMLVCTTHLHGQSQFDIDAAGEM